MKRLVLWLVLFVLAASACQEAGAVSGPRTLHVYAAASLTDAFTEIGKSFEAENPGVSVAFNFGGSQNLRTQIEQGAGVDVFASANTRELESLVAGGYIDTGAAKTFLTNRLVVILPEENPGGIASLKDLAKPGLKLVLAAEEVPAGRYAREILGNLSASLGKDYQERVLANLVSNEDNIRQAVTKVQLGEADASIVYVSDAVAVPGLITIDIPSEANVAAEYPIAPLVESGSPDLANEFINHVLSPQGQATLEKWGFTPVVP